MTFQSIIDALNNHADAMRALAEAISSSEESVAISSPVATTDVPEIATEEFQPNKETARAAILKFADDKGRDAAVAVLSQFGVEKISQLDESQYGQLIEACR
jgi:hypothetical protein